MELPGFALQLRARFIRSLRYEDDAEFSMIMGLHVNRGVGLIGGLGLVVLIFYVAAQVLILGKTAVWSYGSQTPQAVTVLWDKLAIALVMLVALSFRNVSLGRGPFQGRLVVSIGAIVVVVAAVLDDVAVGDVGFSVAYAAVVLMAVNAAVPFKPLHSVYLCLAVLITWFAAIEILPGAIGLEALEAGGGQVVFLLIITVLAVGTSAVMYEYRWAQSRALHQERALVKQLEETMSSLKEAQNRLVHSEKMASLARFVTGMAHELKNPLNFVTNFSRLTSEMADELLERPQESEEQLEELRTNVKLIWKHAIRADNIVTELVSHSDISASPSRTADINGLLREQVGLLRSREPADRSSFSIREHYSETPGEIEVHPSQLARAFKNILENAVQAATSGSNPPEITVETGVTDHEVTVAVTDNGAGVSSDVKDRMFEPFFTNWNEGTHTGLGLAIAYDIIVSGHGGSIDVDSEVGVGTTIRVSLPIVSTRRYSMIQSPEES
jgi:signal transduction histidine kinase